MKEDSFDLAYRLLDAELVDLDGRRCGRVDDLEIEGKPGEGAHVSAILSGPDAWAPRLPGPLRRLSQRLFGRGMVSVPWSAVEDIAEVVRLKRGGEDLGLGAGDDAAGKIVNWLPGS